MYEKLEIERLKTQSAQMELEKERMKKDLRLRCIDIAVNLGSDLNDVVENAKKLHAFVEA